jgi:hypothetical protein
VISGWCHFECAEPWIDICSETYRSALHGGVVAGQLLGGHFLGGIGGGYITDKYSWQMYVPYHLPAFQYN